MRAWAELNKRGRILFCCSILNVLVAFALVFRTDLGCIFSLTMAMFCGLATFDPRYQKK